MAETGIIGADARVELLDGEIIRMSPIGPNHSSVVASLTEFFVERAPAHLWGKPLAESGIGASTGLNVVAIQENGSFNANPSAESIMTEGCELVMIGNAEQRKRFLELRP